MTRARSTTPRLHIEALLAVLRYLHAHPGADLPELVDISGLGRSQFFVMLSAAERLLGVRIEHGDAGYNVKSFGGLNNKWVVNHP